MRQHVDLRRGLERTREQLAMVKEEFEEATLMLVREIARILEEALSEER